MRVENISGGVYIYLLPAQPWSCTLQKLQYLQCGEKEVRAMGARGKLCALYLAMALMAPIALLFIGAFVALGECTSHPGGRMSYRDVTARYGVVACE